MSKQCKPGTKMLSMAAVVGAALVSMGGTAHAGHDGYVYMGQCPAVDIMVTDIDTATGWGAHFSTTSYTNGYGGTYAECHLTPSGDNVVALCYDGYQDANNHTNQFRLDLGPRSRLMSVNFTVTERGVQVEATRISYSAWTSEKIQYVTSSFFPLRPSTGFCSESYLYWSENGVLSGTSSRSGSGYQVSVTSLPLP